MLTHYLPLCLREFVLEFKVVLDITHQESHNQNFEYTDSSYPELKTAVHLWYILVVL